MDKPAPRECKFGPFRLHAAEGLLFRDATNEVVRLSDRQLKILCLFVENPGKLFSTQDLLEKFWPEAEVEENNVTQNISALRRALGEKPGENKYIQTVGNKEGYRFVARVDAAGIGGGDDRTNEEDRKS